MPMRRLLIATVTVLALPLAPADAQVFKCVDAAGNVTYQQEACAGGAKGAAVDLKTDNAQSQDPGDRDGRWRTAAQQGQVIQGMPKRWVQQALGQPREIRRGTAAENVPEVWVYQTPNGPMRVAFRTNAVEWTRTDPPTGPAAPPPSPPAVLAATAGGPSVAGETARSRVAADRKCDEVTAELGPPSKLETIQGTGERPAETTRYTYEPLAGGLPLRLSFTCVDGRVTSVARDIVR
jgi:hypothetical protein